MSTHDPFDAMLERLEESKDLVLEWKRGLARHAEKISHEVAREFNEHERLGTFPALHVDAQALHRSLETGLEPQPTFDTETFDRFLGPVEGAFHFYDVKTGKEVGQYTLYSVWDPTQKIGDQNVQRNTGSKVRLFETSELPELDKGWVDLTMNVQRPDLGITGWVSNYEGGRSEMGAATYAIASDRLLWFNKFVTRKGRPVDDNSFIVTLEWEASGEDGDHFMIYGITFDIDFKTGAAVRSGDRIFKLKYHRPKKGADMTDGAAQTAPSDSAGAQTPSQLPDVNKPIYPYDVVQYALDKVAYFNMYAVPQNVGDATLTPYAPEDFFGINGGYGAVIKSALHKFNADVDNSCGADVGQKTGESTGVFSSRWLIGPEAIDWAPGQEPTATIFDPWRPQSFSMLDAKMTFGNGDSIEGYGVGRTYPVNVNGRPVLYAGGVGNVTAGHGKLAGHEGTFVINGVLTDSLGFEGNITCRIEDPQGALHGDRGVPPLRAEPGIADDATYIVMRGQKANASVRTEYGPPPSPGLVSLVTPAQMRSAEYRYTGSGHGGLRTQMIRNQVVGNLIATVSLDLLAPLGTPENPNDFSTVNVYNFSNEDGKEVGSITAQVQVGKSFALKFPSAPGQPGMRYGGYGPILESTGIFEGVQGAVCVNSAIGIQPHALSMLNIIRISDPDGRFRGGVC